MRTFATIAVLSFLCVSIARAAEEPKVVKIHHVRRKSRGITSMARQAPWCCLTMRGDLDPAVMQKITDTLDAFTIITSKPRR